MSSETAASPAIARSFRFHAYGPPTEVLRIADEPRPAIAPDEVLVRTHFVPVHRGDLLALAGSPAFGDAPPLPATGAVPGLEGMGVIEEVGREVPGMAIGKRVAFFPVAGSWRTHVAVRCSALTVVPGDLPDELAARLLIDVATACLIVRRALAEQPRSDRVLQSGAGSAVGRIVSALLVEAGREAVRLTHSEAGARTCAALQPESPVFATSAQGWQADLGRVLGDDRPSVAIDGVGGDLLGSVATCVAPGGLIVQYGTLGGTRADIRPIVPRRLRIEGLSIAAWLGLSDAARLGDVATGFRLARERPALFGGATVFALDDFRSALAAMDAPGRRGAILIDFRGAA